MKQLTESNMDSAELTFNALCEAFTGNSDYVPALTLAVDSVCDKERVVIVLVPKEKVRELIKSGQLDPNAEHPSALAGLADSIPVAALLDQTDLINIRPTGRVPEGRKPQGAP